MLNHCCPSSKLCAKLPSSWEGISPASSLWQLLVSEDNEELQGCLWDKKVWWGTRALLDGWLGQCPCVVWFAFFILKLGITQSHHSALAWWEILEASYQTRLQNFTACCGRVLPSQCLTEARYPQPSTRYIKPLAVFAVMAAGSKALGQSSQMLKTVLYLIIFLLQKISAL